MLDLTHQRLLIASIASHSTSRPCASAPVTSSVARVMRRGECDAGCDVADDAVDELLVALLARLQLLLLPLQVSAEEALAQLGDLCVQLQLLLASGGLHLLALELRLTRALLLAFATLALKPALRFALLKLRPPLCPVILRRRRFGLCLAVLSSAPLLLIVRTPPLPSELLSLLPQSSPL